MTDYTDMTLNPYAVPEAVADDVIRAADEGRIIKKVWRKQSRGKEMVCALAAFGPNINSAADCPAEYMPSWLAELIPVLDDGLPNDQIGAFARGLGERAKRWHVIDAAAWDRVRVGFLSYLIRSALDAVEKVQPTPPPDYWGQVKTACNRVLDALNVNGDPAATRAARAAGDAAGAAAYQDQVATLFALLDAEISK